MKFTALALASLALFESTALCWEIYTFRGPCPKSKKIDLSMSWELLTVGEKDQDTNCVPFMHMHEGDTVSVYMKDFKKEKKQLVLYGKVQGSGGSCGSDNAIGHYDLSDTCIAIPDGWDPKYFSVESTKKKRAEEFTA